MWYWIADVCAELGVHFVLGHALYMKAIHGGKVKNDRIDSQKIAQLLRAGMLPLAYAYPKHMRSTRDLIRRRLIEQVKCHDPVGLQLLQTVPGIGPTLALVILYEIGDIARFPRVGNDWHRRCAPSFHT